MRSKVKETVRIPGTMDAKELKEDHNKDVVGHGRTHSEAMTRMLEQGREGILLLLR